MTEATADGCALASYSRYLPKSQIFRPIFALSLTSGQSSESWCAITNCGHVITNVSVLHLNIAGNRMASLLLACGVPSSTSYLKPLELASYIITVYTLTHKHSCYHKNIDSRLPPPSCLANQLLFLYLIWAGSWLLVCVCVCVSLHSFSPPPVLKSTQHVS